MKTRPRRKARNSTDPEIENSTVPSSPSSSKENISPSNRGDKEGRLSLDVQHQQFIILLQDFDNNVAMAVTEIYTRYQQIADSLTLPFLTALISSDKLPAQYKNIKWGDYLKMRGNANKEVSSTAVVASKSKAGASESSKPTIANHMNKLATPALRSSSRLAKKLPPITPKFDPATPFTSRMPKIGETLVSINGSPVGMPAPTPLSVRGVPTSLANGADEKELLVALLSNQDTLTNALKDKRTRPGLLAALKNAGKYVGE